MLALVPFVCVLQQFLSICSKTLVIRTSLSQTPGLSQTNVIVTLKSKTFYNPLIEQPFIGTLGPRSQLMLIFTPFTWTKTNKYLQTSGLSNLQVSNNWDHLNRVYIAVIIAENIYLTFMLFYSPLQYKSPSYKPGLETEKSSRSWFTGY